MLDTLNHQGDDASSSSITTTTTTTTTTNPVHNTRKRKLSTSYSEGWAEEFGALEQPSSPDFMKPLLEKQTQQHASSSTSSSSSSSYSTTTSSSGEPEYILISTSRLERLLRSLQNITKQVSIHVLLSVEDDKMFELFGDEFKVWNVSHVVEQLRSVFKQERTNISYDPQVSPKRRRYNTITCEEEREVVRQRIRDYLEYMESLESTSFDDLYMGIIESFRYHPSVSFKLIRGAMEKNRYNYVLYFHAMELFRQSGAKLDCVKELRFGRDMNLEEIDQVEMEISVERSRRNENTELITILERDLSLLKASKLIFDGLIHFFSDGSAEDMYKLFSEALDYDPNAVYAYTNLGVLSGFNTNGSRETCLSGIKLLEKALECCNKGDIANLGSFLYHTIAQTYMRLGCTDEALQNIDNALEINPTMILAYFDKASILRATNDMAGALVENDTLIQINPESPFELSNIYCNRSVLHYKLRQDKAMYESLKKSMEIDPCNSFPYIMLSKQAILQNDVAQFEQLKKTVKPREHMHITHYLQHIIEAYSHFDNGQEVKKHKALLENYEGSWNRID